MNTRHSSQSYTKRYLENAQDRKTLSVILTAVYAPLFLMLGAALFLA